MTESQLAELTRGLAGLHASLRDHLCAALERDLPHAELAAAAVEAERLAYQIAYDETIPQDLLERAGAGVQMHDRSLEELRELWTALGWMALDLAQHFNFANEMLPAEAVRGALERGLQMAEQAADLPVADLRDPREITPGVAVFGPEGLETWSH